MLNIVIDILVEVTNDLFWFKIVQTSLIFVFVCLLFITVTLNDGKEKNQIGLNT